MSMEMINCPRCGKLFTRMSDPICDKCMKEEEAIFERVRDYINDNPDNKLEEVAIETGVSVKKIVGYMKSGRLEVNRAMHGELKCERCNKPIRRGKLCDSCVVNVNQNVADLFDPSKQAVRQTFMHTRKHD